MGGGGTDTSTSTSAPLNPEVNSTLSKLLQGVQATYQPGSGTPETLNTGWNSQLGAATNPDYARGVAGSTSELADIASGKRFGMNDPGYADMRQGAIDDSVTAGNSSFLTDGRFGSTVHGEAIGRGVSQTIAGLDYGNFQNDQQRQMQAISALPTAFAAGQAPGSVQQSVGEQQRAAPWYNLGQASSVLAGTAGAGGQTNTMTQPAAPWWQAPVAIGGTLASAFF
jgi:hypothetical protein